MIRWAGLIVLVVIAGCAYERHFVPAPPSIQYHLPQWPRESIVPVILDTRAHRTDDSARLVGIVALTLGDALKTAEGPPGPPQILRVEIIEHEVSLKGPWWNARTRFTAALVEDGRALMTWRALGEDKRWNMLPAYIDARRAAHEGFSQAIESLMMQLATARFP